MTPEFSRPERLDAIGERERAVMIDANADERAALARRFGLLAIDRLAAVLTLRREAAGIVVRGRVTAAETMALALDPFPRAPAAAAALRDAGVLTEEEARPKGALAGLREVLEKKG